MYGHGMAWDGMGWHGRRGWKKGPRVGTGWLGFGWTYCLWTTGLEALSLVVVMGWNMGGPGFVCGCLACFFLNSLFSVLFVVRFQS